MQVARQKISELLEQAIGLKTTAIGASTMERAVHGRMRATGCQDVDSYLELLASAQELRLLVEEVVVPETWFFRDQQPFTFLADLVVHSRKDLTKDFFRILSLPCSTGEEPYSIAMTLLMVGVAPSAFYIDAVDVSERVLARARQGIYRDNSFRSSDLAFRELFFTRLGDGYKLQKGVLDKVRFLQGNIIHPGFMHCLGRYDVVFCRNVLIYFNEESQRQAIESLHHVLVPGGILFTGYAEASLMYNSKLFSVVHAKAFAFRRAEATLPPIKAEGATGAITGWEPPRLPAMARVEQRGPRPALGSQAAPAKAQTEFSQVRQLADAGRLEEAARRCEENLRRHGPSPEWYYLLGVIRDSQDQEDEALKLLRKAVYLDPKNVDCLVHLALLAERAGDQDGAANYRRRARKVRDEAEL